jgi:hypothetical protein
MKETVHTFFFVPKINRTWVLACLVETRTKETGDLLDDGL